MQTQAQFIFKTDFGLLKIGSKGLWLGLRVGIKVKYLG